MSSLILRLLSAPRLSDLAFRFSSPVLPSSEKRPVRFGSASLSPEKRLDYRAPARPDYFRIPQKSAIVI